MHMGTSLDYPFPELTITPSFWITTPEKPILARTNTDSYSSDADSWNPRLAGYMLSGNQSMFLETDGSLAWLYHCPLVHWPLHSMNQCYDRIAIHDDGQIPFVDANTRQTHPAAGLQNCTDRIKNLFQFDRNQEDSWYKLTPGIVHKDRPAVFRPKDVSPVAVHSFPGKQDAGMYTRSELRIFWDSISKCSEKVLAGTYCIFKQQKGPGQFSLLCSSNRLLCGQHDLTGLLQRSVYGYIWTSCIYSWTLRELLFRVFVFPTHYECCGHGNRPHRRN